MNGQVARPRIGRSLKPFRRPWLWAGLWSLAVALVVVASLLPAHELPPVPAGTDKLEHFFSYFLLSAAAVQLFGRRLSLLSACVALALMGLGLEHLQGSMALGRSMDARDALSNTLGVLAGLATLFTPWRDALLRFDTRRHA